MLNKLTDYHKALNKILKDVNTIEFETISIENGLKRILREEIHSKINIPPFNRAAMDGFAIKSKNSYKAKHKPIELNKKEGIITPGKEFNEKIKEKEAIKITTGSKIPKGADAVIKKEEVKILNDKIKITEPVSPGENVSKKGEDLKEGEKALKKGIILSPQDIAILRSIGKEQIKVSKKPKVGIIATGDELIKKWSQKSKPGKTVDVNSILIQNLSLTKNLTPKKYGIFPDKKNKIKKILEKSTKENDVTIISGGSSKSQVDIPPKILDMKVHGVSIRPGKAFGYSKLNQKPVFVISGYPVAAMTQFKAFIEPYTHKLTGTEPYPNNNFLEKTKKTYKTKTKINSILGRRHYIRVKIDTKTNKIEPTKKTGSGIVSSLTESEGYIISPKDSEGYQKGEKVDLIPWN